MPKIPKKKASATERDPSKPKRPTTAFFFFSQDKRDQVRREHPDWKMPDVGRELGRLWGELGAEAKKPYEEQAAAAKEEFDEAMKLWKAKEDAKAPTAGEEEEVVESRRSKLKQASPARPRRPAAKSAADKQQRNLLSFFGGGSKPERPKRPRPDVVEAEPEDDEPPARRPAPSSAPTPPKPTRTLAFVSQGSLGEAADEGEGGGGRSEGEEEGEMDTKEEKVVASRANQGDEGEDDADEAREAEKKKRPALAGAGAPRARRTTAKARRSRGQAVVSSDDEEDDEEEEGEDGEEEEGEEGDEEGGEEQAAASHLASVKPGAYHPVESVAHLWKQDEPVPFRALSSVFDSIRVVSKRLEIQEILCNFFRSVIALTPNDLLPCLYLCCTRLAPAYEGVELGVGDSLLIKAISSATGRTEAVVDKARKEKGDLGDVADEFRVKQRTLALPAPLTVQRVFRDLHQIARQSGHKSQKEKIGRITSLLVPAKPDHAEPKFIIRLLQGKLRIGLAEQTVLISLAHAITLTPSYHAAALPPVEDPSSPPAPVPPEAGGEDGTYAAVLDSRRRRGKPVPKEEVERRLTHAVETVKQVYSELPSFDAVLPRLLEGGVDRARAACHLQPGVPVAPMLANPTKGVSEVLDRMQNRAFICEWKYDGERAQLHRDAEGHVRIFSRNSEDMTSKYPDLIDLLPSAAKEGTKTYVLDGEVVAFDRESGVLMPFQTLSTRSRKNVSMDNIKVQVIYTAFDLLYLNGQPLTRRPLRDRRELLESAFQGVEGRFQFSRSLIPPDTEDILPFLNEAVEGHCEGLMVKTLDVDASYEPSKRSLNWLKIKKDYIEGLTDTVDLVPVGAWLGKGKRTGVYGTYLLACYNPDEDELQIMTRVGTGFSDEKLKELTAFYQEGGHVRDEKPANVATGQDPKLVPDVWFEPTQVWEVKAADLSLSPSHMAAIGLVDEGRGIALRFPRFLRVRDDKNVEQATDAYQVAEMYKNQDSVKSKFQNDD